jgi:hypothetical protein
MKKIIYLFTALLIAGTTVFLSCSKSSDDTTTPAVPSIHFLAGTDYISADKTVAIGSPLLFGISATISDGKLKRFLVQRIFSGKTTTAYDTSFSSSSYTVDLHAIAKLATGAETWNFTIFDNNGATAAVTLVITTTNTSAPGPIFSYATKVLGAQSSATGSSFASSNGTVYNLADAKTNSSLIDWVYFSGAVDHETLCAPSDPDAAAVFNNAINGVGTWSTRNATLFKTVTDAITWDNVVNDSIIVLENQSGVTNSKITDLNNLTLPAYLAFRTVTGKQGLIRITSIIPDITGSITIDVKVQQ